MNLEQLAFLWPWVFAALPLPLVARYLLPPAGQGPGAALRIPFFATITAALGTPRPGSRGELWVLAALAWTLLVAAAARPQLVGEPIALPMQGRDLMLAVDISESMAEEDMVIPAQLLPPAGTSTSLWGVGNRRVDRLTAVKAVAGDFIERRTGDRVGLILFGTQAYPQAPLSFDRPTVRTLLFESEIGLAGKATAIGDAIGLAVKRLRDSPSGSLASRGTPPSLGSQAADQPVLILLTDGANTAGSIEPRKAAELAAREGVRIYTIGVGAEPRGGFGLNLGGAQIDEPTLEAIAQTTGGRFFRARDLRGLQAIYAALDELEPAVSEEQTYRPVQDIFQWPLGAALLLSALVGLWRLAAHSGWERRQDPLPNPSPQGEEAMALHAAGGKVAGGIRRDIARAGPIAPTTPRTEEVEPRLEQRQRRRSH
jgi:Ca-activated chloride channel family protein